MPRQTKMQKLHTKKKKINIQIGAELARLRKIALKNKPKPKAKPKKQTKKKKNPCKRR